MHIKLSVSLITASLLLMSGCTTYHSAAAKGNVKAINRLHASGENIDEADAMGITPLIYAVNLNQKESLSALLNAGADVNKGDIAYGNTALHHALLQCNITSARLLLEGGADVTLRNKEGKSSLDLVKSAHKDEMVALVKKYDKTHTVHDKEQAIELSKDEIKLITKVDVKSVKELKEPVAVRVPVEHTINTVSVVKSPHVISDAEARMALERMMSKHETLGIRNYLNQYPEMIKLITDSKQQLRYIGPNGWRIMDLAEGLTRGTLNEKEVIEHIESSALPYKQFTDDEKRIVVHYGISEKIINAMIRVTH